MSQTKNIDYLKEDKPIPGQLWVCISFLSPEGIKNCSVRGLKIRGVFGTRQEADERAKELQEYDPDFHVFVGEMGKWLPWDPDPNDIEDQVYQEKELNDLMKGYKDNLSKAKKVQEERKEEMIKKAAVNEQSRDSKAKAKLQKKLASQKQQQKINNHASNMLSKEEELKKLNSALNKEEALAKAEKERLSSVQKEIDSTKGNIETIDSKLEKMQKLYENLQKK